VTSDFEGVNSNSSGGLYVGSSGRLLFVESDSFWKRASGNRFERSLFAVLAVFLVILGSLAAEGAPFASQIVLGTGLRGVLRKSMLKIASWMLFSKKEKEVAKTHKSLAR
jgi:hypothetical protein